MENERYRTILYSIGDGVIVTDEAEIVEEVNRVAQILTGWKENDAIGRPASEIYRIIDEESRILLENPASKALKTGSISGPHNHTLLISKDGNEIPVTNSGAPIFDKTGKIIGSVLIFRDQIIEREQQKKIIGSEALYKGLFSATHDGICLHKIIYDTEGNPSNYIILDLNDKYEQITGLKRVQVQGKHATEAYQTETAPYLGIFADVADNGQPCTFETYFPPMEKYFRISVFSPAKGYFATVFTDFKPQK